MTSRFANSARLRTGASFRSGAALCARRRAGWIICSATSGIFLSPLSKRRPRPSRWLNSRRGIPTKDFERSVALRARTEAVTRHLTEFLKKTDRFAKTIVFCVDQEHADEIRRALNNLNSDLAAQFPDYVCRVTSDEGDFGRGHLGRFQNVETQTPTILTTSQLLTTGVDAPTCKNDVLARVIGSMSEFKQIIGRGTRVRDDYGKLWFNIIDYTGSATRLFADPSFDGDPALLTEEELEDGGKSTIIRMKIKQGFDRTTCRGCLRTSGGGWVLCIGAGALVKSSKFSAAQTNFAVLAVIRNRSNAECIGQNERLQGQL